MAAVMRISPSLPWDRDPETERRFRTLLAIFLGLIVIVGALVSLIKLPEPPRLLTTEVSERLVQLVQEKKSEPPPPVELPKIEEEKLPDIAEEKPVETPKPEEKVAQEVPKPVEQKPALDPVKREKARAEARKQFTAAGFDALADLRAELAPTAKSNPVAQQVVSVENAAVAAGAGSQRALISDRAKTGSGGVVAARASTDAGSIGGVSSGTGTSRVSSTIETQAVQAAIPASASEKPLAGAKGRRPNESIQIAFDTNKAALFSLYNRALRNAPDMKGDVVFRLEIQADGRVSSCEIVSSELNDPDLERKLMTRVKQIDFGAMNVDVWRDTFRMSFFPS